MSEHPVCFFILYVLLQICLIIEKDKQPTMRNGGQDVCCDVLVVQKEYTADTMKQHSIFNFNQVINTKESLSL